MEIDESEFENKMTIIRRNMIDHLVQNSSIIFKSQQIGEPDLTVDEKRKIAEECLNNKPLIFLSRFSQYMDETHFKYFKYIHPECEYEIRHYLQENSVQKSENVIKNRRLEALKRLALEGDYFTEEEMRKRNPLLYEHLVGKYLTEDERRDKKSFSHHTENEDGSYKLSTLLMEQFERDVATDLQKAQEDAEEEIETDTDEEVDEDCCFNGKDDRVLQLWGESDSAANHIDVSKKITEGEKKLLFEEFRSHMYREFIGGKESDFDYSKVDLNTDYDDLDELDRDAQDKYFELESPEDTEMEISEETIVNGNSNENEQNTSKVKLLDKLEPISLQSVNEDPLDIFMAELSEQQNNHPELSSRLKNTVI